MIPNKDSRPKFGEIEVNGDSKVKSDAHDIAINTNSNPVQKLSY